MGEKKRSSWLYGCGLGCGVILLIGAGLVGTGAIYLNRTVKGFDESAKARAELEKRHGAPASFTPEADGAIPPARMEAFLRVREALGPSRAALAESFSRMPLSRSEAEQLDAKPFLEKMAAVLSLGREALSLGPELSDFFGLRSRAMLEAGMGEGEYAYIYVLAYYVWLGHSRSDDPARALHAGGERPGDGDGGENHEFGAMGSSVIARIQRDLVQALRNQLAAQPADAPASWRDALEREIAAMEKDAARLPWQDGLPGSLTASLEPHRARLETTYSPDTNPFELGRTTRRGRWSYEAE